MMRKNMRLPNIYLGSENLPILDTVVLFAAADEKDPRHGKAKGYMRKLRGKEFYLASFALMEFDIVLKSRGVSSEERMEEHALLLKDFPELHEKVFPLNPSTLYLAAKLEGELGLDYFDAGVAAEALQHDGEVISTDKAFERVRHLKRRW